MLFLPATMDSDYHKPRMVVHHRPHVVGRVLHVLALLLLGLTMFCFCLVCASGTWIQKEDKWRLGLANASMVEFDGIIPKNNNSKDEFNVTMRFFLAGFGWEYLNATKKELQAGIIFQGFAPQLKFPDHLRDVAKRIELPSSDFNCLHPDRGNCGNAFLAKWKDVKDLNFSTTWQWVLILLCLVVLFTVLVKDVIITFKKSWMKCHCCFLSSMCPNPKGSVEDNAALPPSFWDGLRLYWYIWGFLQAFLTALFLTLRARNIAKTIKDDKKLANAKMSDVFASLIWVAAACMFIGVVCMGLSKFVNRRRERRANEDAAASAHNASQLDMAHHPGPYGGPAPVQHHQQEPYPAYMPPEPSMPSQVPHPANTGGFNEGAAPPTYAGKPAENPYAKP